MLPDNLRIIGFLAKSHGIDGTMVLRIYGDTEKIPVEKEFLFVSIDKTKIPFFIENIRISGDIAFIKFEGIDSEEKTSLLREKEVYAALESGHDEFDPGILIGYTLLDKSSGISSTITDFTEKSKNPLFTVIYRGKEYLVPVNNDLLIEVDTENKTVVMNLPDGIFHIG